MRAFHWWLVFGCSEYRIEGSALEDTGSQETSETEVPVDSGWALGVSDPVVEWPEPDTDLPEVLDCTVEVESAGTVDIDLQCAEIIPVVADPWFARIQWQWSGLPTNSNIHNSLNTPLLAQMTDDDLDGDIDEDDGIDVVFVAFESWGQNGHVVTVDGATGATLAAWPGYDPSYSLAVADVDGDSRNEIVAITAGDQVRVLETDGSVKWTSTSPALGGHGWTTIADVDADGAPEVLANGNVYDGGTGSLKFSIPRMYPYELSLPVVGDIDLDGTMEICVGRECRSHDGSLEWTASIPYPNYEIHYPVILNADADPEAEVAIVGNGYLGLYEHDGAEIFVQPAGMPYWAGPPCAADFDGDGETELAWPSHTVMSAYELDGTLLWEVDIDDSSGTAGCSAFDFDGDGAAEVITADETDVWVFDGATGAVRLRLEDHASGTEFEYPVIGDLDGDGAAELLVASGNYPVWGSGWGGLTAIEHDGSGWAPTGSEWPLHDLGSGRILSGGVVPQVPVPGWQAGNLVRARSVEGEGAGANLRVAITDACVSGDLPDAPVHLAVQVENVGTESTEVPFVVSVSAVEGELVNLLTSWELPPLGAGQAFEGEVIDLVFWQIGTDGLKVQADAMGTVPECDELDNQANWSL